MAEQQFSELPGEFLAVSEGPIEIARRSIKAIVTINGEFEKSAANDADKTGVPRWLGAVAKWGAVLAHSDKLYSAVNAAVTATGDAYDYSRGKTGVPEGQEDLLPGEVL